MMDLKQEITEINNVNGDSKTTSGVKNICSFCNATKTPLWRAGPSGPKSLCNACGIKYTKKRRAAMGMEKAGRRTEKKKMMMKKKKMRVRETLKMQLKELEREMVLQRNKGQKLGEEERAALLLMALSYGYVYG